MVALTKFVRNTGREYRNAVLDTIGIDYPDNWKAKEQPVSNITDFLNNKPIAEQEKIRTASEQILQLSQDELGQEIILSVAQDEATLRSLDNPYDRSARLFCNEPQAFKCAEHHYFHDAHRHGRMWARYQIRAKSGFDKSKVHQAFYHKLKDYFKDSEAFLIEVYERPQEMPNGKVYTVYQVIIYREGMPSLVSEVDRKVGQNDLQSKIVKPARETTMVWDGVLRQLEIISNRKQDRDTVTQLFAEHLLACTDQPLVIPPRAYDLDVLRTLPRPSFACEPKDAISQVMVKGLVLRSRTSGGIYRIIVPGRGYQTKDIYDLLAEDKRQDLLDGSIYEITGARISVRYMKISEDRTRTRIVEITLPRSCNLKATSSIDKRLHRLLDKWGLVKKNQEESHGMG